MENKMDFKISSIISTGILLILSTTLNAEQSLEEIYKARYAEDMYPQLLRLTKPKLLDDGLSEKEAEDKIKKYIKYVALCQVKAFNGYDPKYRKLAYDTVASGKSIPDSNLAVNTEMLSDVSKGLFSSEEIQKQVKKTQEKALNCTQHYAVAIGIR